MKKIIYFLIALFAISSCGRETQPGEITILPKKITYTSTHPDFASKTANYFYNGSQLTAISEVEGSTTRGIAFTYNGGLITQESYTVNGQSVYNKIYTYSGNQLTQVKITNVSTQTIYNFNSSLSQSSVTETLISNGQTVNSWDEHYTYTNGSIAKIVKTYPSTNETDIQEFEYDAAKKNIFYYVTGGEYLKTSPLSSDYLLKTINTEIPVPASSGSSVYERDRFINFNFGSNDFPTSSEMHRDTHQGGAPSSTLHAYNITYEYY